MSIHLHVFANMYNFRIIKGQTLVQITSINQYMYNDDIFLNWSTVTKENVINENQVRLLADR